MKLNLKRPIVFFDLETTGLDTVKDRIVELSYIKVFPSGEEESRTMRFNPGIHISKEASEVTGISDEDVAQCPTFSERATMLRDVFSGCDLAGFNSNRFDIPLLVEEFLRCGVEIDLTNTGMIDVQTIYHKMEKRTLSAAYQFYCHKDLNEAHTAMADTRATYEVLQAQLDHYDELQPDVDFLNAFSRTNNNYDLAGRIIVDENGTELVNFGKHKGRAVKDIVRTDPGFFSWIQQGDFSQNTKQAFLRLRLKYGNNL